MDNIEAVIKDVKSDSLRKRWLYKFFANLIGLGMGFIIQFIVPKSLGPGAYGNFSFLTNFFTQAVSFFEMGTATCFYTRLSQRPRERDLVSFYGYFAGLVAACILIFVVLTMATMSYSKFWPGQEVGYICLAAGFGLLNWVVQVLNSMVDAYGVTVMAEKAKITQKILFVVIILALFLNQQINLLNFFYVQYAVLLFLVFMFLHIMQREGYFSGQKLYIGFSRIKAYVQEFYQYSRPLFIYSLVGVIANILDRWLLQIYGGSIQQGFFGFSFQLGALCFLFAGALTPLLTREFSIAHAQKDVMEIGRLFERYIPILLFVTAFLTCFLASQAGTLVQIIGGDKYKDSMWPVFIMVFYPIYQVYGQVCGSIFFSMGETRAYCVIGIIFMLLGIPVTYFLIAPKVLGGLSSGAIGLAVKTILVQIFGVNALLYHNARTLKFSFRKYFFMQFMVIGALLAAAFLASYAGAFLSGGFKNLVLKFLVSGVMYTLLIVVVAYFFPFVLGLKKDDMNQVMRMGRRYV